MEFNELLFLTDKRLQDFYELKDLGMLCLHDDFVPAVHYPQITKYNEIEYNKMFEGYTLPSDGYTDVYVHFPFCTTKCVFCHYPSLYNAPSCEKDIYIDALAKEIKIYKDLLGIDKIKPRSILVGGGTPTDLTPTQLEKFLKNFTENCDLSHIQQFNYDVSPYSITGSEGIEKLKIMRSYGVDRLTIGVQSVNEYVLSKMNRIHDKNIAIEAIKNTLDYGFKLNIEFIYGYPGQTLESWYKELEEITKLNAHELQFYRLKVQAYGDQQGSIKNYKSNHLGEFPPIEDTIRMKQMTIEYLKQLGYFENLNRVFTKNKSNISLYAYNQCCMLYDQIAFGITAFSSLRDRFVLNTPSFEEYYKKIEQNKLPFNRGYVRDKDAQERWAIILPLKNYFIRKDIYKRITGTNIENTKYYKIFDILKKYDLVQEDKYRIKLTPKGSFFADEVCQLFYDPAFIPFDKAHYKEGELNPYFINSSLSRGALISE